MANETPLKMGRTEWLICIIAAIGFAFDIYELLMLPLIVRPAIEQLGGFKLGSPEFGQWRDLLIYVPALAGGHLWSPRRISHRPAGAKTSARLVDSSLCFFGRRSCVLDVAAHAAFLPLHDIHRCVC